MVFGTEKSCFFRWTVVWYMSFEICPSFVLAHPPPPTLLESGYALFRTRKGWSELSSAAYAPRPFLKYTRQ